MRVVEVYPLLGKLAKIHRNTCKKISLAEEPFLTQMQNLQQNKQQTWLQVGNLLQMDVSKQAITID